MAEFKREEIKEYFDDFINDQDSQWIEDNKDDIHHYAFNEDYYIEALVNIGTHSAKQWLGDMVFDVIEIIKEYEQSNFGEVTTDFSNPEQIVNMYVYIIGEDIVYEYINKLEEVA